MVPHREWIVEEEELLAAVDDRTRVLAVSQVSFYTGQNFRLDQLAEGVRGKGALLAVDATHASGVVQVPAALTDLCVSSCYKWMLGTHGTAPCYLSEKAEERVASTSFGWRNLAVWPPQGAERHPQVEEKPMPERLEPGNPGMISILFLDKGLERLQEVGIERIDGHARDLSEFIGDELERLGRTVISPAERERRSGNTCFLAEDARGVQDGLAERGVLTWGEYGRVRISGHLYNGSEDIERLVAALTELDVCGE